METKKIFSLSALALFLSGISFVVIGQDYRSHGKNVYPSQDYLPPQFLQQSQLNPSVIQVDPCAGQGPSNPFRSGMFQYEGDFERFASATHGIDNGCVTTQFNATHGIATFQDNNCLISSWKVSHGTPEVCMDSPIGSNHFIHLWSGDWTGDGDFEGEGIFYDCPLDICKYYDISVRLSAANTVKKVYFYLAKGLQNRANPSFNAEDNSYKVPSVSNLQLLHTLNNFSTGYSQANGMIWVKISIPVFKPSDTDMKLWIFTEDDKSPIVGHTPDFLFVDDVTDGIDGSNGTCAGLIEYTTSDVIPPVTTSQDIYAYSLANVNPGQHVEFAAGDGIYLQNGFKVLAGSTFYAHIAPCVTSSYCPPTGIPATSLSVNDIENSSTSNTLFYPNPAANFVDVKQSNGNILSIKLYDEVTNIELGFTQYVNLDDRVRIGIDHLRNGSYILIIKTIERTYSEHLLIQR